MELQGETTEPLGHEVWAILTRDEIARLVTALQQYLTEPDADPEWHFHLGEGDTQLTIAVKPT